LGIKYFLLRVYLYLIGIIKGDKYKYSQEYEDNYKYMTKDEAVWWGYKSTIRQIENAEKGKGIEEYFAKQELSFTPDDSFVVESKLTISAGGDLLSYKVITPENAKHLWEDVMDHYFDADIVYANLETPVVPGKPFSGVPPMCLTAPKMNVSPAIFDLFTDGGKGINFFSTANNHSLDQGEEGLIATLDFLDSKGYKHVGTSRTRQEQDDIPIIEKNGIKVAFISYTYSLNGSELTPGNEYMANYLRLNKPDTDISLIQRHVKIAREKGADIVAALLHWSVEFETYPIENVIKMGHKIMDCGVDMILGGHAHVAQPMEKYSFYDPYHKRMKDGFIIYALGELTAVNLFSKNSWLANLIKLELSKGTENGATAVKITGLKVLPIYTCYRTFKDGSCDYRILDFRKTLQELRNGKNPYGLSRKVIRELKRLEQLLYNKVLPGDSTRILLDKENNVSGIDPK